MRNLDSRGPIDVTEYDKRATTDLPPARSFRVVVNTTSFG